MKKHLFALIVVFLFIGASILGFYFRQSYTDITSEPNYLDQMQVAEISAEMCISACKKMRESLPAAPIIVRVSPTDDLEHQFGLSQQKVMIKEVYAGDGISVGDEIFITSTRWRLIIDGQFRVLERGFVNILQEGADYLVFLTGTVAQLYYDTPIYWLYNKEYIVPVFCYDDIPNTFVPPTGESTYIPYSDVKNNEFFSTSEAGFQAWDELKQELFILYPAN